MINPFVVGSDLLPPPPYTYNVSGCGTSGPGYNNSGYIISNVPKSGLKVLCAALMQTRVHFVFGLVLSL